MVKKLVIKETPWDPKSDNSKKNRTKSIFIWIIEIKYTFSE